MEWLFMSGMAWAIFGAGFVLIFIALAIWAENMRQRRKMAMRELLQKERIAAMEKGMPLPEWDRAMLDEEQAMESSPEFQRKRLQWFRFTALAIALFLAFGGLGMWLAFSLSSDRGFHDIATIGFIPFMAGLGLLLFYYLTRKEGV